MGRLLKCIISLQADGGEDDLSNAAPLCASCHDLYGGNPEKRKTLRQMRDYWWQLMERRQAMLTDLSEDITSCEIELDRTSEGGLHNSRVVYLPRGVRR